MLYEIKVTVTDCMSSHGCEATHTLRTVYQCADEENSRDEHKRVVNYAHQLIDEACKDYASPQCSITMSIKPRYPKECIRV